MAPMDKINIPISGRRGLSIHSFKQGSNSTLSFAITPSLIFFFCNKRF